MRLLVVGAKGFVGASLVRTLLRRGHTVTSLELREGPGRLADIAADVEWRVGDCTDQEVLLDVIGRRGVDGIYFGPFFRPPKGTPALARELDVMAASTWRAFQLARVLDIHRILFPSSTAVHGPQDLGQAPLNEMSPVLPHGLYGAMKLLTERVGIEINASLQRNVVTSVRIPSVYGPGAAVASRGVNIPAVSAAHGRPGRVDYQAQARVCIAHVDDIGETLADLFEASQLAHSVYEIGGVDASFGEIAETVAELVPGACTEFGDDDRPILPHAIDISRLRAEVRGHHRDLRSGMESVIRYERSTNHAHV
ncbi:NAD(P)-dependent oxidoreductase [Mycobacterium sp. E1747]|uniref:NAD-dependent epimerase/dehydratase family protein n=1 Tax=Mycobacterium sp. E1747 TaxID=1834128 RepID=UPI0009ED9B18|nr:NAD(P)-dependent oxidoreductase [Mycobacterium sp. E1747]